MSERIETKIGPLPDEAMDGEVVIYDSAEVEAQYSPEINNELADYLASLKGPPEDPDRTDAVAWEEHKHPRGQPGNAGQFGSGGGGAGKSEKEPAEGKQKEQPSGPLDLVDIVSASPQGQQLERFLFADPADRAVLSYSHADTPPKTRAVLRHVFTTEHHLKALVEAFGKEGSDECKKLVALLKQSAAAPHKLALFMTKHEAKEWYGAVRAISSISAGETPEGHHITSLVSATIKIATMAGVAAVAGTLGEWATPAALAAIGTEFATHAIAEHSTKFSLAGIRLLMRKRRQDATEEDDEGDAAAMAVLLGWLADAVANTDLTEFFEKATKALENNEEEEESVRQPA